MNGILNFIRQIALFGRWLVIQQIKLVSRKLILVWMAPKLRCSIKVRLLKAWMRRLCFQDLSAGEAVPGFARLRTTTGPCILKQFIVFHSLLRIQVRRFLLAKEQVRVMYNRTTLPARWIVEVVLMLNKHKRIVLTGNPFFFLDCYCLFAFFLEFVLIFNFTLQAAVVTLGTSEKR